MIRKEYTINSFKISTFPARRETITASGRWTYHAVSDPCYDINYSSILTRLIQEAGRWCESYASDLFIDWEVIVEHLKEQDYTGGKYLFGFRQCGVDGNSFVLSRLNNGESREIYRAIWLLNIIADGEDITMTLGKADF